MRRFDAVLLLGLLGMPAGVPAQPPASTTSGPATGAMSGDMPGTMSGAKPIPVPSTGLSVTVSGKTTAFSPAELKAMPQTTVKVHNEHTRADESYTSVPLADLLARCGFAPGPATHRRMLDSYVRAEGTDAYWVLYSATEVEPTAHAGQVLVALAVGGHDLGADGALKLVSSEDVKPARWVRNLKAVTLVTVP